MRTRTGLKLIAACWMVFGVAAVLPMGHAGEPAKPVRGSAVVEIVKTYGSVPGGVVLEGQGGDFGKFKKVDYDAAKNAFLIDGVSTYRNPVSKKDMRDIILALRKDDRIGMSLAGSSNNKLIVYGAMSPSSTVIKTLRNCDDLLGDIVLALEEGLKRIKVVGGYKPQRPGSTSRHHAVFFSFTDFKYKKSNNEFRVYHSAIDITIVPLKKGTARDGGHAPDYKSLEKGDIPAEYVANANHVKANEKAYRQRKAVAAAVLFGEAAAFARACKKNRVSLDDLAKAMK